MSNKMFLFAVDLSIPCILRLLENELTLTVCCVKKTYLLAQYYNIFNGRIRSEPRKAPELIIKTADLQNTGFDPSRRILGLNTVREHVGMVLQQPLLRTECVDKIRN